MSDAADARRVRGEFRDFAPHIEAAVATVVGGELRILPADPEAYPPGFVLCAADEAVVWTGDLVPPMRGGRYAGGQQLLLRLVEPVQGRAGSWVVFGDGRAAFRPDELEHFEELLRDEGLPRRDAPPSAKPRDPDGGLHALGYGLLLAVAMGTVGLLVSLPKDLPPGVTIVGTFGLIAAGLGALVGLDRWWMGSLLVRVSRRQRVRRAGAAAVARPTRGGGTVLGFTLVGLAIGAFLYPQAEEPYRTLWVPAGCLLAGLAVGLVWVLSARLPTRRPDEARTRALDPTVIEHVARPLPPATHVERDAGGSPQA